MFYTIAVNALVVLGLIYALWLWNKSKERHLGRTVLYGVLILVSTDIWDIIKYFFVIPKTWLIGIDIAMIAITIILGLLFLWHLIKS